MSSDTFKNVPFEGVETPGGRPVLICPRCDSEVIESDYSCAVCGLIFIKDNERSRKNGSE